MDERLLNMERFLRKHDLIYEKAPLSWNQGLPLGNGDMGVVMWGDGTPLKITLDKLDAWELRERKADGPNYNYKTLRKLLEERRFQEAHDIFERGHHSTGPFPTRLPVGRANIDLGAKVENFQARLSLHNARVKGRITSSDGQLGFSAFIHADRNILVLELNPRGKIEPIFSAGPQELNERDRETLRSWGYSEPQTESKEAFSWWRQEIPGSGNYTVMWAIQRGERSRRVRVYLTIALCREGDSLKDAEFTLKEALSLGSSKLYKEHASWWKGFWDKSFLTIPDSRLESLYYIELYKLACCSKGKLAIPLQGVWTAEGALPPWSGDYHLDMNVQESYWPVYASNHLELGMPLYDMFWRILPKLQRFCKEFYGWEGAMSYATMAYDGSRVGGWWTTDHWPGNGPWIAHHFWLHYLYSQDKTFLRERAYPFMREFMKFYVGLLEKGKDGLYHIPWSNSPEWGGGEGEAWGPDVTCDFAFIRFLGQALQRSQEILGIEDPEAPKWREILENLAPYPSDSSGLLLKEGTPLTLSHRHHSHLIPIHPLDILNIEGTEDDRKLINQSIFTWKLRGYGEWSGWSFPWASSIASRVRKRNMAWKMLQLYMDAFITENTFHLNGDYKEYGLTAYTGTPMTLEAGFAAAAAVMDMLLQSWNGKIRLFPAIPGLWSEAYFHDLRAEGAFLVTSRLTEGKVAFVEIKSEVGRKCRVQNPFSPSGVDITDLATGTTKSQTGDVIEFQTEAGGSYRLTVAGKPIKGELLKPLVIARRPEEANYFGVKEKSCF